MKFYLFDEDIIIASNNQQEAEKLHTEVYEEHETVEEINDDYVVDNVEIIGSNISGYDQIYLFQVVDKDKKLPFIVDTDLDLYW